MSLSQREKSREMLDSLRFITTLTTENVWDAFTICTLIRQHERENRVVIVNHKGLQKVRFTALMEERNEHVILYGQDEVRHYCDKCTRFWEDPDGTFREYCSFHPLHSPDHGPCKVFANLW